MLHVNGAQTVLGLLCVIILFFCALYATEMRDGLMPREERYLIVGDVLDFICNAQSIDLKREAQQSSRDRRCVSTQILPAAFLSLQASVLVQIPRFQT
jgi:hypothetical protein